MDSCNTLPAFHPSIVSSIASTSPWNFDVSHRIRSCGTRWVGKPPACSFSSFRIGFNLDIFCPRYHVGMLMPSTISYGKAPHLISPSGENYNQLICTITHDQLKRPSCRIDVFDYRALLFQQLVQLFDLQVSDAAAAWISGADGKIRVHDSCSYLSSSWRSNACRISVRISSNFLLYWRSSSARLASFRFRDCYCSSASCAL